MTIVLTHGVAFGPETLAPLVRELSGPSPGDRRPVLVMERRGYGSRAALPPPSTLDDHVADLVALLDRHGIDRAVVAGASGGATVAHAAALLVPGRVAAAVCHEPAVGSLAPELQAMIREALDRRALPQTLAGAATWARLPASLRDALAARAGLVAADARAFLAWEPPRVPAPAPVVHTVGERSPALRHGIAQRLEGRRVVVPGCGHLPQFDAPAAFAAIVLDTMSSRVDRLAIAAADSRP